MCVCVYMYNVCLCVYVCGFILVILSHSRSLEEERLQVEKEYSRLPKREELEAHIRDLNRQRDELNDEVSLVRLVICRVLLAMKLVLSKDLPCTT